MRVARVGGVVAEARAILRGIDRIAVTESLLDEAVSFTSAAVRTLDAIHLASALRARARSMLVYDRRLAEAAEAAGIEVLSPGA